MKRKWSKEKIVQTIKEFRKKNIDLSAGNVSKKYVPLFMAACSDRYFYSWANAIAAAGIDYDRILEAGRKRRNEKLKQWSKEKLFKEIRRTGLGDLLTTYRDRLTLYSAARREFGSWKLALEAAGYRLKKGPYKNSNQIFRLGETPTGMKKALKITR